LAAVRSVERETEKEKEELRCKRSRYTSTDAVFSDARFSRHVFAATLAAQTASKGKSCFEPGNAKASTPKLTAAKAKQKMLNKIGLVYSSTAQNNLVLE
jgi:hypothetical protein